LLGQLMTDTVSDGLIGQSMEALKRLSADAKRTQDDLAVLEERMGNLAAGRRASSQAAAIDERLKREFPDDLALHADLDRVIQRIRGELSKSKVAALSHAAEWESALREIESAIRRRSMNQQQEFEQRKHRYLELLRQFLKLPANTSVIR